jgi:ABC-type branched-subunit amino acid transport system permease subunit/ABC-type branched-subunit amino acid transport system ATPase component
VKDIVLFAILGLGAGSAYALIAQGLILIHRSTGVVNFAHGAIAMVSAYTYVWFTNHGFGTVSATLLSLPIAGVLGAAIQQFVMKPLSRAPLLAKLVATLGLVLIFESGAGLVFGNDIQSVPPLLPTSSVHLFGMDFGRDRLILLVIALVLAAVLSSVSLRTRLGSLFRAAADSEEGVAILGYSLNTVAMSTWVIGAVLAGFAGIIIAPITTLSIETIILLVIPALSVTLLAGFTSFWLATIAGLVLGIVQSELAGYWKIQSPTIQGMQEALPFLLIIVVMMLRGRPIPGRSAISPGRPPLAPPARARPVVLAGLVIAAVAVTALVSNSYQTAIAIGMISSIVALSLVVLTGYVGQISLAQMSIAGMGAYFCSRFASDLHIAFPFSVIAAGLAVVPFGALLGLPALRVRGVNLAVVTLGAAVAINALLFSDPNLTGGFDGISVPSPQIFGYSLDGIAHPFRFAMFALLVLILSIAAVAWIRRGRLGLTMLAVRDSERAAAAEGVNIVRTKLTSFVIASFLAGLAGAIFGTLYGHLSFGDFDPLASVTFVTTAYIGGIGSIAGAVIAGVISGGGPLFNLFASSETISTYQVLISGVGVVLTAIANPDGVAPAFNAMYKRAVGRWRSRAGAAGLAAEIGAAAEDRTAPQNGHAAGKARRDTTRTPAAAVAPPSPGGSRDDLQAAPLLEARGMRVTFGSVSAVDGVDLVIRPGTLTGLIGPNGAGKTTLIDALCGFVRSSGQVSFAGTPIDGMAIHQRARLGLRRTFQNTELFADLTIAENLLVPVGARQGSPASGQLSVQQVLELVGLDGKADRYPRELSTGETKLAGVARALSGKPLLLLLDEPAAGLDSEESRLFGDRLLALLDRGVTMVLVEHDLDLVMSICGHVVVLDGGRVLASGAPEAVRADPAVRLAYLGADRPAGRSAGDRANGSALRSAVARTSTEGTPA